MIPADNLGKFKTTLQMVVITIILAILVITDKNFTYSINSEVLIQIPYWSTFVVAITTFYSGMNYIIKHSHLFKD